MVEKLNLGSGAFKKKGYVNVDCNARTNPDVVHDLNVCPYPFPDNYFQTIEADHVLEHLDDPFKTMKELHRILKNDGQLIVRVPHFSRGFTHADHKSGFDVTFPFYFRPDFKGGYSGVPFDLQKMQLRWFAQMYLKEEMFSWSICMLARLLSRPIDLLANLFPYFCSRVWCFWVGGFEQIEFKFVCRK